MATVSRVANWYEDPSGRHEGRFWDGYTWTAHVFDAGVAAIDPPTTASPAPASGRGAITEESVDGHGTRQLRAMAAQARIRARAAADGVPDHAAAKRRTLFGMSIPSVVGLAIVALVAAVGIWATGILQPGSGSSPSISTTVSATGDGFTAEVPLGWARSNAPDGSPFDASYSTLGLEPIWVGLGDLSVTDAQLGDPATRTEILGVVAQMVAAQFGQVVRIAEHQTRSFGGQPADFVTVEVAFPDGGVGQVAQYLLVGSDRSVVLAASGTKRTVARQLDYLAATARSVQFLE